LLDLSIGCAGAIQWHILIWDNKPSHTRMGIRYEHTRMGRPIRVWDKYAYGTEHGYLDMFYREKHCQTGCSTSHFYGFSGLRLPEMAKLLPVTCIVSCLENKTFERSQIWPLMH